MPSRPYATASEATACAWRAACRGEELVLVGAHGIGLEEHRPALGDHHRVHDDVRKLEAVDGLGYNGDDTGIEEHPSLHGIGPDVGDYSLYLLDGDLRREGVDVRHFRGVLGGGRDDGGRPVDAAAQKGLEGGLDAGPRPGVAGRYAYHLFHRQPPP